MNNDLISREALKEKLKERYYNDGLDIVTAIELIDNAPAVEPFEPDYVGAERLKARQRGYEAGYRNGMEMGKTLNPKIKQGDWNYIQAGMPICPFCGAIPHKNYHEFCAKCGAKLGGFIG